MESTSIELGPFVMNERLTTGGMGEVWRGRHRSQDVDVAIKVITSSRASSPEYQSRFRREVQAVAQLSHPHVVSVYDCGLLPWLAAERSRGLLVARSPYLVMEYVSWGSLRGRSPLPWGDLKQVLLALLDALAHAHARGLVHRDIKPENILLGLDEEGEPVIKLSDFGIAHPLGEQRATWKEESTSGEREAPAGTPAYMAPEQFQGRWRDYGPWTDLYSLGVLAYQLTTGELPFVGTSFMELAMKHHQLEVPALAPSHPMPPGLEAWLERLMRKDPRARFKRAADAAWALMMLGDPEGWEPGESVLTQAPPVEVIGSRTPVTMADGVASELARSTGGGIWRPSRTMQAWARVAGTLTGKTPFEEYGRPTRDAPEQIVSDVLEDLESARVEQTREEERDLERNLDDFGVLFDHMRTHESPELPPMPDRWQETEREVDRPRLKGVGLGLLGLRAPEMVNRESERNTLWWMLSATRRSRSMHVLSLRGDAGVGKNRLADWLTARAHECGAAEVLAATHAPVESPDYGLVRTLSESFRVVGLSEEATEERIGERLRYEGVDDPYEWRALTSLLCEGGRGVAIQHPLQRYALFERHLMRVARERPVLLWLRDAHYGEESLQFVKHLLSRRDLLTRPIMVVMTARDDILSERAVERALIEEIESSEVGVSALGIDPLSELDCASLLYQHFGLEGGLARRVARRVEGSPLFAIELAGSWLQRGDLIASAEGFALREGETGAFPDELFRIWSERVDLLLAGFPHSARRALWLAAALGRQVVTRELQRASKLAGVSFPQRLLDELFKARLALPSERGWEMAHSMLREALERDAREQGEWIGLNDACATTLLDLYGALGSRYAERMARHLVEAGRAEEALEYLLEAAGSKINSGDFARAKDLLARTRVQLDVADVARSDVRRGRVLWLGARCLGLSWALDEAHEAACLLRDEAQAHGWGAFEAEALYMRAHTARQRGEVEEAMLLAEQARPMFEQLEDRRGLARVVQIEADLMATRNEPARAFDLYGEALEVFEALGEVGRAADCLMACGHVHRQRQRLREAETYYRDALVRYRSIGTEHKIANCVNALAELFRFEGDLERARLNYERAHKIYVAIGSRQAFIPRINMGLVELEQGSPRAARDLFAHALDVCEAHGLTGFRVYPLLGMAACAAIEGDPAEYDSAREQAMEGRGEGAHDPDVAILAERAGDAWSTRMDGRRAREAWSYALVERRALGHVEQVEALVEKLLGAGQPDADLS